MLDRMRRTRLYTRVYRRHEIVGQFVRYAIVGVANVIIFYSLFTFFLLVVDLPELAAYVAAFVPANVNSYFLNKRWAFRDERTQQVFFQYMRFAFFTIVAVGLNTGVFALARIPLQRLDLVGEYIATLVSLPLSVAWNFASYRYWTFTSPRPSEPVPGSAAT